MKHLTMPYDRRPLLQLETHSKFTVPCRASIQSVQVREGKERCRKKFCSFKRVKARLTGKDLGRDEDSQGKKFCTASKTGRIGKEMNTSLSINFLINFS